MPKYLPAQRLAQLVLVCLAIETLVCMASIGSTLMQAELLGRMQAGAPYTEAEANFNDLRQGAIGTLTIIMALISAFLFLKYLGRTNHNARALGVNDLSATPGWTIGYYFVPILNFFKPYQILQEIWKASAPETGDWKLRAGSTLVGWYWGVRIVDLIANRVTSRLGMQSDPEGAQLIPHLLTITWISFGAEVCDLVLNVLSIFLVRNFQRRQEERHEIIGEPTGTQCPSCGEPLEKDIKFVTTCPLCGAAVQPVAS